MMPAVGSNISSQTMAMATGVAIMGRSMIELTSRFPDHSRLSRRAMATPSTSSTTRASAVK